MRRFNVVKLCMRWFNVVKLCMRWFNVVKLCMRWFNVVKLCMRWFHVVKLYMIWFHVVMLSMRQTSAYNLLGPVGVSIFAHLPKAHACTTTFERRSPWTNVHMAYFCLVSKRTQVNDDPLMQF